MRAPRPARPRVGPYPPLVATLTAALVVVLVAQLAGLGTAPARVVQYRGIETSLSAAPSETAVCATINSNASLRQSYVGFYDSLANDSPNWGGTGPNSTPPVNQSGYRNASAGGQMVVDAWISICESPAYTTLYRQWGPTAVTSGSELAANGHYLFLYGIYFHASCTNPNDTASSECGYETDWTLDLVTGSVTGPVTTNEGPPLGGPPLAPPSSGSSSWSFGGLSALWLATVAVAALLGAVAAAALVLTQLRRRGRRPPQPSAVFASGGEDPVPASSVR